MHHYIINKFIYLKVYMSTCKQKYLHTSVLYKLNWFIAFSVLLSSGSCLFLGRILNHLLKKFSDLMFILMV